MSDTRVLSRRVAWIAAVMAVAIWIRLAAGLSLNESKKGIWGKVADQDGNPMKGVVITLAPLHDLDHPEKIKTTKRGSFVFPRVEFYKDGYRIGIESDEYFIREFHLRTRRGSGEIWQDDSGHLVPNQQDKLPPLKYRGANATVSFVLAKIEGFKQEMARREAAEQAQGKGTTTPQRRALTPLDLAEEALGLGDYATAVAKYGEAIEADPNNAKLRFRLAKALARTGDTGAALRAANETLEVDPAMPGVRLQMAEWMDETGQLAAAVPLLEKENELDPANAHVLGKLVSAYEAAGQQDKAETTLEQWVEAAPEDPQALMALASSKARKKDFAAAEELYRRVAEMDPENAHLMFFNAGASIINRKGGVSSADRERAADAFKKALEVKPDYARAHLMLADTLVGLGRFAEAKEHYQKFLELQPDSPRAAKVRGMLSALP